MRKRRTLKWLGIFAAVLLASMFFARTIQTITTPKIRIIQATRGKLEDKIPVQASLTFPQGEDVYLKDARTLNIVIMEVLAGEGFFVNEDDLLARCDIPALEQETKKIKTEYETAVRALGEHIVTQVRLTQDSPHNQVYEHYFVALQAYYDKRLEAEALAARIAYELPQNVASWGRDKAPEVTPRPQAGATPAPVPLADMPPEMKDIMQDGFDAWRTSESAFAELRRIYTGNSQIARTGDATFDYIKKVDGLGRAAAVQGDALVELKLLAQGMMEVRAPHSGYLTSFALKKGDTYDGTKPLYVISREKEVPTLKADITDITKTIEKGTQVEADGARQKISVSQITLEAGGKKYAIVELSESLIVELGGVRALMSTPRQITLLYKSPRTTTLLPASAVRTDMDGSSFVYSVEQNWGGMLGNTQYILKKQPVTVTEKSNRLVAISEDVSYLGIADGEDRAVIDGQVVMEYVD